MIKCPACGETEKIDYTKSGSGRMICTNCYCQFDIFAGGSGGGSSSRRYYSNNVEMTNELAISRLENIFLNLTDFTDRAAVRYAITLIKQTI